MVGAGLVEKVAVVVGSELGVEVVDWGSRKQLLDLKLWKMELVLFAMEQEFDDPSKG